MFLSCSKMCRNSRCPLGSVKRINFDSCSGQFAQAMVFSADDLGNLALLIRSPKTRFLSNDIFFCEHVKTTFSVKQARNTFLLIKNVTKCSIVKTFQTNAMNLVGRLL